MRPTPCVDALADAAVVACPVMIAVAMSEQRPSLIAGLLAGILAMVGAACGPGGTTQATVATPTAVAISGHGQQPNVAAQRAAMQKLDFLVGTWSGPETVITGSGAPLMLTQTEVVQIKLGGLVMLVEGTGSNAAGQVLFTALATIAYDDVTSTHRFRAYNSGNYIDAELKVTSQGFTWGYGAGSMKVSNTMQLNAKGEWTETTETTVGSSPPRKTVDMTLQRQH